jgi:hypothetical protein
LKGKGEKMPKLQLQPGVNPMLVDQSESSGDNDNDSLSQSSFEENSLNADSNSGDHNSSNDGVNHEMKEIHDLAQEDTRNLRAWRIVIVLILVSTFTGVITGIVAIIKKQYSSDCEIAVRISYCQAYPIHFVVDANVILSIFSQLSSLSHLF